MRRTSSLWIVAGVVVAAIGAWTVRGFHANSAVNVTTSPVTSGPIVRHIIATGTLQAITTVQVGAQVSGTIQELDADFNSIVHAGQVIAKIDPALFEASVNQTQAALGQARATLAQTQAGIVGAQTAVEDARIKLKRAEELSAKQLIPQSDLDAARIAMDSAAADLKSAQAQTVQAQAAVDQATAAVVQSKVNLDHTVISSPIDGIVLLRNVDVGQTVASAVQAPVLFNIAADLRKMQVEVDVDEADIAGVQVGAPVTFEVESYRDEKFQGTVSVVRLQPVTQTTTTTAAPTGSQQTGAAGTVVAYATIISVLNPDQKLRPGMTATVTLDAMRRENAVRIPSNSLSFRPSPEVLKSIGQAPPPVPAASSADTATARQVWRYENGRFTPIDVRVGIADGQWTELVGGSIRPGEVLVTNAK